jgi:phytol kinase
MLNKLLSFFIENIPSLEVIVFWFPIFLLWTYGYLSFIGYLKVNKKVNQDYTRKPFHIIAFLGAFILQKSFGLPLVFLYAIATSLVVFYAVVRGENCLLYQAMAREKDAPYKTYYIVVPYFAALVGGFVSNILFGSLAIVGYLVVGLGDAAGELVGVKWGKHKYVVPTLSQYKTTRSYEGSLGVLIVSSLSTIIALSAFQGVDLSINSFFTIFLIGFLSALLEGISPHGWDNVTLQIAPSYFCFLLIYN